MGDVALVWVDGLIDLAIVDDDLAEDAGLQTSILRSLFEDRRAQPDDILPAADGDLRGWCMDEFSAVLGDLIGSRLWLLDRSTRREDIARRSEEFVREALAWALADKVTDEIDVAITLSDSEIAYAITIYRPIGDPAAFRFSQAWDGTVTAFA